MAISLLFLSTPLSLSIFRLEVLCSTPVESTSRLEVLCSTPAISLLPVWKFSVQLLLSLSTSRLKVLFWTTSESQFPSWKSFCQQSRCPSPIVSTTATLIQIPWLEIRLNNNSLYLGLAMLGTFLTTVPHQLHSATYPQPPKPQQTEG